MSSEHIWRAAQERLRREMSQAQFETWFRGTVLHVAEDGCARLAVRSTFARELLETRYRARIEAAIAAVTGRPCSLEIAVTAGAMSEPPPPAMTTSTQARVTGAHAVPRKEGQAAPLLRPSLFALADEPAPREHPRGRAALPEEPLEGVHAVAARRARSLAAPADGGHRRVALPRQGVASLKSRRARTIAERSPLAAMPTMRASAEEGRAHAGASAPLAIHASDESGHAAAPMLSAAGDSTMFMAEPDRPSVARGQRGEVSPRDEQGEGELPEAAAELEDVETGGTASLPALQQPRLNPRYTFATFIVGSGNQLAHAASVAVAEAPGSAYNPLFLYGDVGLGKTHLLHAIGHATIERGLRVLYVSSETFTNEIINAIRFRTTEEFRAKYRSVDMLLVDDIQFIAGKDSTEEEFFHTFNSLYETSKQIVICSDRPPKAIVSLEERLRSRFQWGLIADIQPPDLETRVAILRAKADLLQRSVPDEVLQYLAAEVHSNIRELEGSLNRLLAIAQLQGKPLSIETARAALSTIALDGKRRHVSTGEVLTAVAEFYHIPVADLQGKQRDKRIVVPRQVAMYLMRQETEASLLEIGQVLGGRDHSTVLHGCEKIGREINENTTLRKEVLAIRQHLLG